MVKVVRLDAQGQWNPFADARVEGCVVETKGDIAGIELQYSNDNCDVTVIKGD